MPIGQVPEVLDLLHVGQSGIAVRRLHAFLTSITDTLGTLTSPWSYIGDIAVNTSFPLIADVQKGDFYHITADVTDNAGVTYTNTAQSFLAGDDIVWNGTAWTNLGQALTSPLQYKGSIAIAANFPAPTGSTGVKSGHVYIISAAVTDNDGTKTNTGQVFYPSDVILWTGAAWSVIGKGNAPRFSSATFIAVTSHGNSGATKTLDFGLSQHHSLTLTANCALTFTNPAGPSSYILKTTQGGAGGYIITWPVNTEFAGGTPAAATAALGAKDVFSLYFDGTVWHVGVAIADSKVAP